MAAIFEACSDVRGYQSYPLIRSQSDKGNDVYIISLCRTPRLFLFLKREVRYYYTVYTCCFTASEGKRVVPEAETP